MTDVWKRLREPFPERDIEWRVGSTTADKASGLALPYVNARAVMERLDDVLGPENWSDSYRKVDWTRGWVCRLTLTLGDKPGGHLSKQDGADETDIEPTKGGISDALKRAAVKFGVGRYLYRLPSYWLPIKPRGKSHVLVSKPQLPAWALPGGSGYPDDWGTPRDTSKMEGTGTLPSGAVERVFPETGTGETTPPPPKRHSWAETRTRFVANTTAMAEKEAERAPYWQADGPNDHVKPRSLAEGPEGYPEWFDEPHGQPGKKPLEGWTKAVKDMKWGEFAAGSCRGNRMSRLVWEIDTWAPPENPAWISSHERKMASAKAVVLWIMGHRASRQEALPTDEETPF